MATTISPRMIILVALGMTISPRVIAKLAV
jgi:hypothetical protein